MRTTIIAVAGILCVLFITVGIYLGVSGKGVTRSIALDPSYTERLSQGYWAKGTVGAPVVLTEFSDFQCEPCLAEFNIIEAALRQTTVPFEFRFRHYPLPRDDKSILAAEAAEAAGRQGKFWNMYELLFLNQPDWSTKTTDQFQGTIGQLEQSLGIKPSQFASDLADTTIVDPVNADIIASNQIGASTTPALLLNGKVVNPLPQSAEELLGLIKSAQPQS